MGTVRIDPNGSFQFPGQYPGTAFGAATHHDALGDNTDASGVHFGTTFANLNHGFYITWQGDRTPAAVMPATARIDWVRVEYRARHVGAYCMIWVGSLHAFAKGTSNPHSKFMPVVDPGWTAAAAAPIPHITQTSRTADDGFAWNDCETFHTGIGRWGPSAPHGEFEWDPSNYPYMTKIELVIGYTLKPVVNNISPTGTVTNPRPTVTWGVTGVEETGISFNQVIVLPSGSVDAAGVTLGDTGFDPTTGSGMAFNTGKTTTPTAQRYVDKILAPGTWWIYVRQWVGTGVLEYGSDWASSVLTVEALTVDTPTIVLADDTASNTVKATIDAGPHVEDLLADTIEVQYYDPVYADWVPAQIENSMVPGTGTSIFYDGTHAPGEEVSYRVRGVGIDSGVEYASPWVTVVHTVGDLRQWWLRSTVDFSLNRNLNDEDGLLMKSCNVTRARPNAATWGIGSRPATVVHDVTKGDVLECEIWAMSESAYLALRALLEDGDDLMLVNPWGQAWRVQPGTQIKEDIVKASPRSGELTALGFVRTLSVNFIEVGTA